MRLQKLALLLLCCGCQADPLRLGPIRLPATAPSSTPIDASSVESGVSDASGDASPLPLLCSSATDAGLDSGAPPPLPFVVDRYFFFTGGVGDAAFPGAVRSEASCDRERPSGAEGHCYHFEYTPRPPQILGLASYAALFFQYPAGNWGGEAGLRVQPGAHRVVFYAAGAEGGELVTFGAGGIRDPALPCFDDFARELTVRLTPDFTRYEIDLSNVDYNFVISPFSWKISEVLFSDDRDAGQPIGFYLDDVHWE